MKTPLQVASITILCILMVAGSGFAQVPHTINYQGSLKEAASGTPVDGTVQITFALYDVQTGGTSLWSETHSAVSVEDGIYSVILGTVTPLDSLTFDQPYYLELTIGGEVLTPRQPLTSVPYSMKAMSVEGLTIQGRGVGIGTTGTGAALLKIGDFVQNDDAVFTFKNNWFSLAGSNGTDWYPYIAFFDENAQQAMYVGYGSKQYKRLDFALNNDHFLQFRGTGDFLQISDFDDGASLQIGTTSSLPGIIRFRPVWSTPGIALTSIGNAPGLFVSASDGSVGIGNTSPQYPLDVTGTIRGDNVSPSDRRWKEEIAPFDDALERVTQLQGVTFRWNDPSRGAGPQIGVIAQEVEQVFPEVVSTDSEGYKSVAYDRLVAPLIEAVKALKTENEALKAQNEALERRIAAIEAIINEQ